MDKTPSTYALPRTGTKNAIHCTLNMMSVYEPIQPSVIDFERALISSLADISISTGAPLAS